MRFDDAIFNIDRDKGVSIELSIWKNQSNRNFPKRPDIFNAIVEINWRNLFGIDPAPSTAVIISPPSDDDSGADSLNSPAEELKKTIE